MAFFNKMMDLEKEFQEKTQEKSLIEELTIYYEVIKI